MKSISLGTLTLLSILTPLAAEGAITELELNKLDSLRKGKETNYSEVERIGALLLKEFKEPADQGRIYYRLSHVYAQSGLVHPEKVIEHAKDALKYPLSDNEKLRLHVYCGDATQVMKTPFAERRRTSAAFYFQGLHDIQNRELAVDADDPGPPPNAVFEPEKRIKAFEKWTAASEKFKQAKVIANHKRVMIRQITDLYARRPPDDAEAKRLSKEYLGDSPMQKEFAANLDETAKARSLPAKPPAPDTPLPSGQKK